MLLIYFYNPYDNFLNRDSFTVLKKYNNTDYARSILQTIDITLLQLIDGFNNKYSNIDSLDMPDKKKIFIKEIKKKLNKTYRSSSLQENFPKKAGLEVSYNVNKGQVISLCLRDYNNPDKFHDVNDLIFVAIHEVAHSCNNSYGHDTKFWKVFRTLLEVAVENNLYSNVNYQSQKKNYCSMDITYNPLFDNSMNDTNYFKL
jgi:predicted metal-dependent hydrolase